MKTKQVFLRLSLFTSLVVMIVPLASCGFCVSSGPEPFCKFMNETPPHELTSSDTQLVFEEPGTIAVYHGFGCAKSDKSGREDALKVEQSLDLPAYAGNATVFLNGWRVQYLSKDHHVGGFSTFIEDIGLERNRLKWRAVGALGDEGFDDGYSWCYNFTVVAWNPSNLNLTVDHESPCSSADITQANSFFAANNYGTSTALSSYASFLQNPAFASSKGVAVLPRGFAFGWGDKEDCNDDGEDHHLLQVGYNLDHSEAFIENGKSYWKWGQKVTPPLPSDASRTNAGYVSWETFAIFKDDSRRRTYTFGETVSAIAGNDVGVIQSPFSFLPWQPPSLCSETGTPPQSQEFVVEGVPFEFAIPMLTGWELGYLCTDRHVAEAGVWIDEWSYDKAARTLRYRLSSALRNKDSDMYYRRHKVTILGLRPLTGVLPLEKRPDLVPFSPLGSTADKFCRIEQGGQMLRVTVKNQGNDNAGPSKTTVTFINGSVTLDTPAIPAGGSTELLFRIPPNCFGPDCSFRITVDSGNQVNEPNNEGNNSIAGTCIG
ncbi:MAG TPA: CARDB domain-containing protein [Pyrinomonadaceae bacterium]|nr:CARDB domain-containing protein [Pyrinomonadaceae bacterium]